MTQKWTNFKRQLFGFHTKTLKEIKENNCVRRLWLLFTACIEEIVESLNSEENVESWKTN